MSTERKDRPQDYGGAWFGKNMEAFIRLLSVMTGEAETEAKPKSQQGKEAEK